MCLSRLVSFILGHRLFPSLERANLAAENEGSVVSLLALAKGVITQAVRLREGPCAF